MAILGIAGSGRGVGKTAVACAILAAMPELCWTAVKVSPHAHGEPEPLAVREESDPGSQKDTGRFLRAGAKRAYLVSGTASSDAAVAESIRALRSGGALLIESNRVDLAGLADPGEATLRLAILAGSAVDWKPSLRKILPAADALVWTNTVCSREEGPEISGSLAQPHFYLQNGVWATTQLLDFILQRLSSHPKLIQSCASDSEWERISKWIEKPELRQDQESEDCSCTGKRRGDLEFL